MNQAELRDSYYERGKFMTMKRKYWPLAVAGILAVSAAGCQNTGMESAAASSVAVQESAASTAAAAETTAAAAETTAAAAETPSGSGEHLTINTFPEEGTPVYEIDKLNQFGTFYTGLWEGTAETAKGDQRSYKIYVPEDCRRDASAYFIAVPDGVDTDTFLIDSGWIKIANEDKVVLCVFEPQDQKWGSAEDEADYFKTAYSQFNGTVYVYHDIFNWRWIGYGAGGEHMQRYIMNNPMTTAAAVIVDGSENITKEEMDQIGGTFYGNDKVTFDITYGETPVPVWLISSDITSNTEQVIDYWKEANDVTEDVLNLQNGTEYHQDPFSASIFTYDQKVGTVRVTEEEVSYIDPSVTEDAYEFVNLYARSGTGSPYSNSLTRSVSDDTFIRETDVIDGYEREWYVYTPENYDPSGDPLPMVIFYHGTGQSGLLAMRQGDWWKLAEEKGFIAVCPSATLETARSPKKIPQMSWNVEDYGNADDIVFTSAMIDAMAAKYNVDLGRVYATGQSNGGRMSIYAGLALPKRITAVASAGASALTTGETPTEYFLPKELDESYTVPFMATLGEYDMFNFDLADETSDSYLRCQYFCNRYGLAYDDYLTYTNGRNQHAVWLDDNGVPLQEQVVIGKRAHSHRPVENRMMWDEWFCWFSRDTESGQLFYMNKVVD